MIYNEEKKDLFSVSGDYMLTHCISADFALGAGIAKEFNRRYDMKKKLFDKFPGSRVPYWDSLEERYRGFCVRIDNVYNLITKKNYWNKPTLAALENSLNWMKEDALYHKINKIAMPQIGCGLDRLNWKDVSGLIKKVFEDTDIEILVCIL